MANVIAERKSLNVNSRWMRGTPPTSTTRQPGTWGSSFASSASESVGTPPRQGTQVAWVRPAMVSSLAGRRKGGGVPLRPSYETLRPLVTQRLDEGHRLVPRRGPLVQLADVLSAHDAVPVDDVERGPVLVVERVPVGH